MDLIISLPLPLLTSHDLHVPRCGVYQAFLNTTKSVLMSLVHTYGLERLHRQHSLTGLTYDLSNASCSRPLSGSCSQSTSP
jgi:hypothetical protein